MSRALVKFKLLGKESIIIKNAANIPAMMTNICCFCVILTAFVPPLTVYIITRNPMITLSVFKSQPSTVDKIIEGAYIVIPAAKPL